MRFVARLQAWRRGEDEPIDNLAGYARTLSVHTCYGVLRREFPERTRLRNKIRYVVTHQAGVVLEESPAGTWQCRVSSLRQAPAPGSTRAWIEDPVSTAERFGLSPAMPLPSLVIAILQRCDTPVDLDDLVDGLARVIGIADAPPPRTDSDMEGVVEIRDQTPDIAEILMHRQALNAVWTEVLQLPERQRSALLLNLRDGQGGALIQTLPATGVTSKAAIAEALMLTADELDRLWPDLPLDDLRIAERLGITRQQVINLRKSGRARLARRVAGNIHPAPSSSPRKGV